ncbi:hypothetical protein V6N11_049808 [Hibiscus sabdariffa]|uniref:Reverse transcriptase zinc-binding domain-containing protein n=2 Tax=Hibiscus sabdariffa TaxID=183260 RepID=A0ABR2T8G1_9ROSI
MLVSDLLLPGSNTWNAALIRRVFSPTDCDSIMSIRLPFCPQPDRRIWCGEKNGLYSVRSDYRLLLGSSSPNSDLCVFYKKLWSLKCPAKVRINLWKFSLNFVPTRLNLFMKHVSLIDVCPRGCGVSESVLHFCRDCDFVKAIWRGLNISLLVSANT